jgi:hypothetical protein
MIYVDYDNTGLEIYMVTNDYNQCLIRTTNRGLAYFVDSHSRGLKPGMFLLIGGDAGSRKPQRPIFHHIRRYSR